MSNLRSFKFKLYTNTHKNKKLAAQIELASEVWNWAIEQQRTARANDEKYTHVYELQKQITQLKRCEKLHWNKLNSQVIQDVTERVNKSYQRFFRWAKTRSGPKMLPPKFKSRKKYKSITFKNSGWQYNGDNTIKLNGVKYRFHKSREVLGDIKTVTVKRDNLGAYWVTFTCDNLPTVQTTQLTGYAVGVDMGLKTFLTLSDASEIIAPEPLKASLEKLRETSRQLSRKQKGSNNHKRTKLALGRLHQRITNLREDFHWKAVRYLISNYDVVALETLNIEGMKRLWGRKISDLAFSGFVNKLEYVAQKEGKVVLFVDKWFPSTKTCFDCGFVNKQLKLKDREWYCPDCGVYHDRDLNAAMNILAEAERAFSVRLEHVNPLYGGDAWLSLESHML